MRRLAAAAAADDRVPDVGCRTRRLTAEMRLNVTPTYERVFPAYLYLYLYLCTHASFTRNNKQAYRIAGDGCSARENMRSFQLPCLPFVSAKSMNNVFVSRGFVFAIMAY